MRMDEEKLLEARGLFSGYEPAEDEDVCPACDRVVTVLDGCEMEDGDICHSCCANERPQMMAYGLLLLAYVDSLRSQLAKATGEAESWRRVLETMTRERDEAREIALRQEQKAYRPWASSGGAQECPHGIALFIACERCDVDTMRRWEAEPAPPAGSDAEPTEAKE